MEFLNYYRPPVAADEAITVEVCVFGSSIAAVAAAVQLQRFGRKVALVINAGHAGGMTTSGLGCIDFGAKEAIGGLSREFFRCTGKHYRREEAWLLEPRVARAVVAEWLEEAAIVPRYWQFIKNVRQEDNRIKEVAFESGLIVAADYFIDASYEGDLLARAGVTYSVGREPASQYGELLNGFQVREKHQFIHRVCPYVQEGDAASGLLPEVKLATRLPQGEGDSLVQAYNFRLCLTDADDRIPFEQPPDYDPSKYTLLARYLQRGWRDVFRKFDALPGGKVDMNNHGAFSTDLIGGSHGFPEGSYAERERIYQDHLSYQKGLLWFLSNDEKVPADLRVKMRRWGLPRDEFQVTGGWPPMLYIREARRMVSDYVLTEHDCWGDTSVPDAIGLGAYAMDSHNCQRLAWEGRVINEGDVQATGFDPYPVSYRSIVPARGECANLAVPVCLSASHIAYGSVRMEPVFMVLGQSAAAAVHLAISHGGAAMQEISSDDLTPLLLGLDQRLAWQKSNSLADDLPASELQVDDLAEEPVLSAVET